MGFSMVRPTEKLKFKVKANPNHPTGENPVLYKGKKIFVNINDFKIGWRLVSDPKTDWTWNSSEHRSHGWSGDDQENVAGWITQEHIPIGGIYIAIRCVTDFKYWYNYAHQKMENSSEAFIGEHRFQKYVIPVWHNCKGYLVVGMNDKFQKYNDNGIYESGESATTYSDYKTSVVYVSGNPQHLQDAL